MFKQEEGGRSKLRDNLIMDPSLKIESLVVLLRTALQEREEGRRIDSSGDGGLYGSHEASLEPARS